MFVLQVLVKEWPRGCFFKDGVLRFNNAINEAAACSMAIQCHCKKPPSPCGIGKYYNNDNICVDCNKGKFNSKFGSFSESDCKTCVKGQATADASTACQVCTRGKYQDLDIATSYNCKTCDQGQATADASTACSECTGGKHQDLEAATKSLQNLGFCTGTRAICFIIDLIFPFPGRYPSPSGKYVLGQRKRNGYKSNECLPAPNVSPTSIILFNV